MHTVSFFICRAAAVRQPYRAVRQPYIRLQTKLTVCRYSPKASERRHARSAINTTQADRCSVVLAMLTQLRASRRDVTDREGCQSHDSRISPICRDWSSPSVTTLRSACMVLIAPVGASHASGMFSETVCTPSLQSTVASLQS